MSNAGSMVGAMVVTSGFGAAYWLLAARLFPHAAVGFAGASISAMTLLGNAGMLGLGTLLIGELPRQRDQQSQLIAMALAVAGLMGAGLGLLFALAAPFVSRNLQPLAGNVTTIGLFALGAALTSVTAVLDQALIGVLRGGLQFGRNAIFAATKLGALLVAGIWLANGQWLTIYTTWLFGNLLSLALLAGFVLLKGHGSTSQLSRLGPRSWAMLLRRFGFKALGHHWLNLALQVPGFALPLVVTALLSPAANAYFYVASMVAGLVYFGPLAIVTALYAVGSHSPAALAHRLRFTLGLALVAGLLVNIALFLATDPLLNLFGAGYAEKAGWTLRVLGLGVFPVIIKDHYITLKRIHGRMTGAALFATAGSILELGLATAGAIISGSLIGLALGWLGAFGIEAALMAPTVYRAAIGTTASAVRIIEPEPESTSANALVVLGAGAADCGQATR